MLIVCLYVDDLIYTGNNTTMFGSFKKSMMAEFEMSDLGMMHYFLGIEVVRSSSGIFISQKKYVRGILDRFQMKDCNPVNTPSEFGLKLNKDNRGKNVDNTLDNGHTYDICNIQHWTCLLTLGYKLLSDGCHVLYLFLEIDSLDADDVVVDSHDHCCICLLYLDLCLYLALYKLYWV